MPKNQNLIISRELARIEELYEGVAGQLAGEDAGSTPVSSTTGSQRPPRSR